MHLKQLKLAGFKSFVDPTVVHFPSQLVAVLGPNGCGKSNIIDAVRWVMGESSAKNLRGESMTDVIFNGSSQRKPVGQASVELVFDNSLGRLLGPFASYNELSVKRVVTRDGDSSYYLNGSRCRKKDITDIFLGTGAGARGYSIIGQGTISRLIEAKPEELRSFLEEAAGVSKYKERRRETLQRINQAQEHLNRVADIREELAKQLHRLERQAKAAELYTALKAKESVCRAEIMALKWRDYYEQQAVKQKAVYDLSQRLEEQQSALTQAQTQKILLNEGLHALTEQGEETQALFYQLGLEVARLEEHIQQHQREQKRLEQDHQQLHRDWHDAQAQIRLDEEQLHSSHHRAQAAKEQLTLLGDELKQKELSWLQAQQQSLCGDEQWQEAHNNLSRVKGELQISLVKQQHSEHNRQQLLSRLEKIHQDKNAFSPTDLERVQGELEEQHLELKEQQLLAEHQLQLGTAQSTQLRTQLQAVEQQIHQLHSDFHRINSEYAALAAIQKAAVQGNQSKDVAAPWSDKARLIDLLQVEQEWQTACEYILHDDLHAYVVEDCSALCSQWNESEHQGVSALTLKSAATNTTSHPKLIDKMNGNIPATAHHLESIYAAEHVQEACQWLSDLLPQESIITRDGTWLGIGWIKSVSKKAQDELGLLGRQQKIAQLSVIVDELQDKITHSEAERDRHYQQLQEVLQINESLHKQFNASNDALRAGAAAVDKNQQELYRVKQLLAGFMLQEEELHHALEEASSELVEYGQQINTVQGLLSVHEERYARLQGEKEEQKVHLSTAQQAFEAVRADFHQAELVCDREQSKTQLLVERITQERARIEGLGDRLEHTASLCAQAITPLREMQERLAEQLVQHHEIEQQLSQHREQIMLVKMELEDADKKIVQFQATLKQMHELIAQIRMEEHELAVRAAALQESLAELTFTAEALLARIPAEVKQGMREDELIALNEQIKRLGAINLAAIDEFASEQQRKLYLDAQHADLSEALSTLHTAIDKMDKETRMRLEHTFAEVNASFTALFPRLFGGGRAQLELTCDNLLEAGIVVMAQPPGKRNSTIHLLSGGEKAMTAVALVFAIFQLNPSPFCMLDEVDAPLDDVNVGRFCGLVKEMSQFVQFLFITHNKVTMELADHLIGVTMREPGVSRLVAVDVTEALTME